MAVLLLGEVNGAEVAVGVRPHCLCALAGHCCAGCFDFWLGGRAAMEI